MKIFIRTDESASETEISITCKSLTPEIEKVVSALRLLNRQLSAQKDAETYLLDISDVFYIETVDKKTFIYTAKDAYETDLKLYELEAQLDDAGFFRAGKSSIINLRRIKTLKADIDRRIRVTMENGEQLVVSRQYADELKKRLGVK